MPNGDTITTTHVTHPGDGDSAKLKGVYKYLSNTLTDMPSFDAFASSMQDEETRKNLYNYMKGKIEMPSYKTFSSDMMPGGKAEQGEKQQATSEPEPQPEQPKVSIGMIPNIANMGYEPGTQKVSVKPVPQPPSLEQAVDEDNEDFKSKLTKTATLNYMLNHKPSVQEAQKVLKAPPPVAKTKFGKAIQDIAGARDYLGNELVAGVTNMISGAANAANDMMANAPIPSYQPIGGNGQTPEQALTSVKEQKQQAQKEGEGRSAMIQNAREKASDFLMSTGHEQLKKDVENAKGVLPAALRTVGGFVEFAPSMIAAAPTAGASLFFSGYQTGLDQVADNDKIDPNLKPLYALGYGALNAALMSIPIGRALDKKLVDKIASKVAIESLTKAMDKTGGKLTGKAFMNVLNNAKQEVLNKMKIGGIKAAKGFAEGAVFSTAQQGAEVGLRKGFNALEGRKVLNTPDFKQFVENVGSGTLSLGLLNFGMGAFHTRSKDYIKNLVAEAKKPEDITGIHDQVDALKQKGKIDNEQANELHQSINAYTVIKKTLPEDMTPEQTAQAFDQIRDRNMVNGYLDHLEERLDNTRKGIKDFDENGNPIPIDPALQKHQEKLIQDQITHTEVARQAKNDQIIETATNKQFEYRKNGDLYEKRLGRYGQWEPVNSDPAVAKGVSELVKQPKENPASENTKSATPVEENSTIPTPIKEEAVTPKVTISNPLTGESQTVELFPKKEKENPVKTPQEVEPKTEAGENLTSEKATKLGDIQTKTDKFIDANISPEKKEKHYQEVAGSKPVTPANGIPSEPIVGEKPKRLNDITKDLVTGLHLKIRKIKPERRKAGASYRPGDSGVITRYSRNLKYIAHETGHFLDDKFGLLKDISKSGDKDLIGELKEFSKMEMASKPPKEATQAQKANYRLGEGFAEWLRNYIAAPKGAREKAPNIFKLYSSLPKEVKDVIEQYSKDYRIFEGSTAFDRTMASVKMEPDQAEGILKQVFKKKETNPDFEINWTDKLAANWVDPLRVFEKAAKYLQGVKGLEKVLPENDPYILARLFLSVDRKFGQALEKGLRDGKGEFYLNQKGEKITLNSLLKHFDNTSEETIHKEMQMVVHYMISQRVVELKDRFQRAELISGIGGGVVTDLKNARQGIKEFEALPESTRGRLRKAIQDYRDMADATLKYMVEMGRLSKKQYDIIKADNLYYVALNRIRDISPDEELILFKNTSSGKIGTVKQPIKKIKGGEQEIQNPYLSLLDNLHRSIKEADRNKIMLAFRELMLTHRGMHKGKPIPVSTIGTLGKSPHSIPVFVDGKAEHWTFRPELYRALKGIDDTAMQLPWVAEALATLPRLLRSSIVYFPTFQLRNITRDTFDSFVKSTTGKSFKHFFKGTKQDWDDVAAMGGLNAGYYAHSPEAYYAHMNEAIKKLAKDKTGFIINGDKMKRAFRKYEHFLEKGETLNRVAEYRSAFAHAKNKLGYDDYNAALYAAFRARDLMDFALMGYQMRLVNKFIPFSNAALQGVRSAVMSAKEKPGKFAVRLVVNTVVPQIIVWVWNHRNEEAAKRYEEIPAWQRDLFWNIPIGANKYLTIPKPYELGMPAAAIDRGLSKLFGYKEDAFNGYAGELIKSASPVNDIGVLAGPLAPIVEVAANKDFFRDKHIISPWEEPLPLEKRHTEYASRIGQSIQKVSNVDARYIDFLLRNTLGYYGSEAIKLSNIGRKNTSTKPGINDIGFFRDYPAYNSNTVQKMMDYARTHQKTSTKDYKKFRAIVTMYFRSKTSEEKEILAKDMIDYADELIKKWDHSRQ